MREDLKWLLIVKEIAHPHVYIRAQIFVIMYVKLYAIMDVLAVVKPYVEVTVIPLV
jgi:hypothetical protein